MKSAPLLSDLVRYRNELDAIDMTSIAVRMQHTVSNVLHVTTENPLVRFKKHNSRLVEAQQSFVDGLNHFCGCVSDLRQAVDGLISEQQPAYYERSWRLFNDEMKYETVDHILRRRLSIDSSDRDRLRAKVLSYSDWRVPGMVIRPGLEDWVDHLVALDPLYLVDQHPDLLTPALQRFPIEYQRRIRPYVIDDRSDEAILSQLPSEQFGYIFAYNFFNFRPIELFERYFKELWQCLRPGGTLLLTFNDCDLAHGAGLVEHSFMCYTPGSRIREIAQSQGYEIVDYYHGGADCAWVELRRPGKMRSMRGAQTLAKIIPRSK